ncbi:MAG: malectin domain-containing carbohydrate-binding protein [Gemmataceae bacterium]
MTAIDAYNGAELWRRRLSVGVCTGQQPASADDQYLFVHDGASIWQFDAQTGAFFKAYSKKVTTPTHDASKPLRLQSANSQGDSGAIDIVANDAEIVVTLTTTSKSPSRDDRWELAFDFRPVRDRLQAPGRGTFELVLDPWNGTLLPHPTFPHPHPKLSPPVKNADGTAVTLRLARGDIERFFGRVPDDFALAADVKLWTEDFRVRLWGKPMVGKSKHAWPNDAEGIVRLRQLRSDVAVAVASLDDAPAGALKAGRLPPMTRHRTDGDFSEDFKEGLGKEVPKGKETMLQRVLGFELAKRLHPLTGEDTPRDYSRSYGCSGTSCSAAMDFFRSGTIGMYDRFEDAGMRNISGIRSGCGQTLVPAFGMLLYSESASDCLCSYSFATSLAMAPARIRRNEDWALFDDKQISSGIIRRSSLNLGAPGDRRDEKDQLWLAYPRPNLGLSKKTASPLPFAMEVMPGQGAYRINTDRRPIGNTDRPWVYGSGIQGIKRISLDLIHHQPAKLILSSAAAQPPAIDGKTDDACWDGFAPMPFADRGGQAYFRHDANHLYVAYEQDPPIDKSGKTLAWKKSVRERDGAFDKDDHFRLTLFNAKAKRFLTFAVTAGGALYDSRLDIDKDPDPKDKRRIPEEDVSWDSEWTAKIDRQPAGLRIEMAIPWKTLTDAGLNREGLLAECQRKTRWGGAKDASIGRLIESATEVRLMDAAPAVRIFSVRLHFAEVGDARPGERVFDVMLNGKTILKDLDVTEQAGGPFRALVREISEVQADRHLELRFIPKQGRSMRPPMLSAIEVIEK